MNGRSYAELRENCKYRSILLNRKYYEFKKYN